MKIKELRVFDQAYSIELNDHHTECSKKCPSNPLRPGSKQEIALVNLVPRRLIGTFFKNTLLLYTNQVQQPEQILNLRKISPKIEFRQVMLTYSMLMIRQIMIGNRAALVCSPRDSHLMRIRQNSNKSSSRFNNMRYTYIKCISMGSTSRIGFYNFITRRTLQDMHAAGFSMVSAARRNG
jgi:hypothetical protein